MKKVFLLALVVLMISGLANAQTRVIFGNRDGNNAAPIEADTNQALSIQVWINTPVSPDTINIVGVHLPLSSNNTYIQPASRSRGDLLYPFPLWQDTTWLSPNEDNIHSGYTNQSLLAVKDFPRDPFPGLGIKTNGEWWNIASYNMVTAGEGDGIPHNDAFIIGNQQDNGGLVLYDYVTGELHMTDITIQFSSLELPLTTGVEDNDVFIPDAYSLAQNYPNPFNASTTIKYNLPEPGFVNIDIYDIMGRKIQTLVSQDQTAGSHSVVWNASNVSSGVYLYKIVAGDFTQTKRCNLIK